MWFKKLFGNTNLRSWVLELNDIVIRVSEVNTSCETRVINGIDIRVQVH